MITQALDHRHIYLAFERGAGLFLMKKKSLFFYLMDNTDIVFHYYHDSRWIEETLREGSLKCPMFSIDISNEKRE